MPNAQDYAIASRLSEVEYESEIAKRVDEAEADARKAFEEDEQALCFGCYRNISVEEEYCPHCDEPQDYRDGDDWLGTRKEGS